MCKPNDELHRRDQVYRRGQEQAMSSHLLAKIHILASEKVPGRRLLSCLQDL